MAEKQEQKWGIEKEGNIFSNRDGEKLFRREWPAKGEIKAICFFAHGMNDNCVRYEVLFQPLTENGVFVFAHDHYGHGHSPGPRCIVDSIKDVYVRDVLDHIGETKKLFPAETPTFLIGTSMGGMIALMAGRQAPSLFRGVVLACPAVVVDPETAPLYKRVVARMLGFLFPNLTLGDLDLSLCSRDPAAIEEIRKSPLRYNGGLKIGMGVAFLNALADIEAHPQEITFPFLVTQGTADKICNPAGADFLSQHAPSKDKTILMYTDMYHGLFHDLKPDTDQVIRDTVAWVVERIEKPSFEQHTYRVVPSAVSTSQTQ